MTAPPIEWLATACSIIAASMVSLDIGRRVTGYGFLLFAVGSVLWLMVAREDGQAGLWLTNLVLLGINLIGVWRWLIRRAPG